MKFKSIAANLFFAGVAVSVAGYFYLRQAVRDRAPWLD